MCQQQPPRARRYGRRHRPSAQMQYCAFIFHDLMLCLYARHLQRRLRCRSERKMLPEIQCSPPSPQPMRLYISLHDCSPCYERLVSLHSADRAYLHARLPSPERYSSHAQARRPLAAMSALCFERARRHCVSSAATISAARVGSSACARKEQRAPCAALAYRYFEGVQAGAICEVTARYTQREASCYSSGGRGGAEAAREEWQEAERGARCFRRAYVCSSR